MKIRREIDNSIKRLCAASKLHTTRLFAACVLVFFVMVYNNNTVIILMENRIPQQTITAGVFYVQIPILKLMYQYWHRKMMITFRSSGKRPTVMDPRVYPSNCPIGQLTSSLWCHSLQSSPNQMSSVCGAISHSDIKCAQIIHGYTSSAAERHYKAASRGSRPPIKPVVSPYLSVKSPASIALHLFVLLPGRYNLAG